MADLQSLEREECLELLRRGSVGRIAVDAGGKAPAIRPVNYLFDESSQSIVFRTAYGSKLQGMLLGGSAAFEIDGLDPVQRTGWSVVVVGRVEQISNPIELRRLESAGLEPWAAGPKPHWIRIRATTITGRRIASG